MTPDKLRQLIESGIPGARAEVEDYTGGGDHYRATVIADAFAGKTMIEQHQMVYATLGDAMKGPIHALALDTCTPQQWEKRKQ